MVLCRKISAYQLLKCIRDKNVDGYNLAYYTIKIRKTFRTYKRLTLPGPGIPPILLDRSQSSSKALLGAVKGTNESTLIVFCSTSVPHSGRPLEV